MLSLFEALQSVPDHRSRHGRRYPLAVVLAIAVSAMVSGARSLYAIAQWAEEHRKLMTTTFDLPPHWTPSHATFFRVFAGLDVAAFEAVVHRWLHEHFVGPDEAFAVDGITRTDTRFFATNLPPGRAAPRRLLQLVRNHWSTENRLHYVRDITFDEDCSPIRTGNGPRTIATLRSLVISLLRACRSPNIATLRTFSYRPRAAIRLITIPPCTIMQ